ncbi:protein DCL homolog, chloroplastic-like [Pistacia vera]|uniref:protein DCL homolog, chloroplastic-like n=1 Tax=Pistacia vera TaxID=55513 RepID=UPI0012631A82|nr:protein DCL homolog, chloroplastic-like [Pistacia vera]
MASVSRPTAPPQVHCVKSSSFLTCFNHIPSHGMPHVRAVKIASDGASTRVGIDQGVYVPDLLRKPVASLSDDKRGDERGRSRKVDWEDQILSDTVPLVGLVRMILHSGRYKIDDRLSPEHEKVIVERLLPYHPNYFEKTGCGIDHIMVSYHPDFEGTRCLFIVQKDGEMVDFSYWKCIHGLIRKKYPLHAESFILRHFRRNWRRG